MRRVGILHYAAPPIVGGVESTIYHHARLLARGSSLPVEDIAAASGFACSQTLRRAFRREFGETLGQARGRPT